MSDQPPPGPPKPSRRLSPSPGLPRESRFIGYLVLGFGILAVIAVVVIAISKKPSSDGAKAPEEVSPQTLVKGMADMPVTKPPVPKKELNFPRDSDVNEDDMQGTWQAAIGEYTGVLQFQKGVYQVILASPDPNAARLYSSGTYKGLEDIYVLTPKLDWPPPVTPGGKKIAYDILTRAPFPIIALFNKGKMVWQNPPQSEKRVLVPYKNPLLVDENESYILWSKLD